MHFWSSILWLLLAQYQFCMTYKEPAKTLSWWFTLWRAGESNKTGFGDAVNEVMLNTQYLDCLIPRASPPPAAITSIQVFFGTLYVVLHSYFQHFVWRLWCYNTLSWQDDKNWEDFILVWICVWLGQWLFVRPSQSTCTHAQGYEEGIGGPQSSTVRHTQTRIQSTERCADISGMVLSVW